MDKKIFLVGFMGSGKTFWSKKISHQLQIPLYDLDEEIVTHEGMSIVDIFEAKGEPYFRNLEHQMLHTLSQKTGGAVISCGGGTPCYKDNMDFMNQAGITVWLNISFDKLISRLLKGQHKRPLIKDMNNDELRSFITHTLEKRLPFYSQSQIQINDEDLETELIVEKIFPKKNYEHKSQN